MLFELVIHRRFHAVKQTVQRPEADRAESAEVGREHQSVWARSTRCACVSEGIFRVARQESKIMNSPWRGESVPMLALRVLVFTSLLAVGSMQEDDIHPEPNREKCFINFVDGCTLHPSFHDLQDDTADAVLCLLYIRRRYLRS